MKQRFSGLIERNNEEQIIEKKWKEYFLSYPDGPFYDVNKYFYDNSGRLLKIEYYLDNKLKTVYEFEYDSLDQISPPQSCGLRPTSRLTEIWIQKKCFCV